MKKTMAVMLVVVFVLLAFTALAMAEECADKRTGIKHYNMGAYDLAEACFHNYLPTNPDAEAHYYLGLIQLLHRNNPSAASNEFSQAGNDYKDRAAQEMRQMAIAIGQSNPGRANTLFEEYVRLMPNANKDEITEFFFHLAVDKNMKLIVSEETKEDCFAFAKGFNPAATEKLISSYRAKWLAEGKSGIRKDLDAGNYSGVVERMNKLIAKGAKPGEIAQASRECLSALMGDPDKGIHGDAYMVGKEATVEDERICAELGLGKKHVDTVAPRWVRFTEKEQEAKEMNLPWGIRLEGCDAISCTYFFGQFTKGEKPPFQISGPIGRRVGLGPRASSSHCTVKIDNHGDFDMWTQSHVEAFNNLKRNDDSMMTLMPHETMMLGLIVESKTQQ